MRVAEPIVEKVQDNINALKIFEKQILESNNEKFKDTILNFPIVYIHNWNRPVSHQFQTLRHH